MSNAAAAKRTIAGSRGPAPPAHGATVAFIVERLREDILAGRLPPGSRLVECDLTSHFGVSRGPVREALRRLSADGLIEHWPHRGAVVRRLTEREIRELFLIRIEMEALAARLAAMSGCSRPAGAFRRRDPADLRRGGPQPMRISQGERRLPRCGDGACRQSSASRAGGAAAVAAHHGPGRRRPDAGGARGFGSGAPRHRAGHPRARSERRVGAHARPSRARRRARACQSPRGPSATRPGAARRRRRLARRSSAGVALTPPGPAALKQRWARALQRGKIHVDDLALHRRRRGRLRFRRRWTLSAKAVAGAAHRGPFARHDRRDRRPHLASAGAGARHPGRLGVQLLLDPEIGDGDLRRPRHSARSGAGRIRARRRRRRGRG